MWISCCACVKIVVESLWYCAFVYYPTLFISIQIMPDYEKHTISCDFCFAVICQYFSCQGLVCLTCKNRSMLDDKVTFY